MGDFYLADTLAYYLYLLQGIDAAMEAMLLRAMEVGCLDLVPDNKCDWNPKYFHAFYAKAGYPVGLMLDTTKYPYSMPAFRQALSMAVDRNKVVKLGEYGYAPAAAETTASAVRLTSRRTVAEGVAISTGLRAPRRIGPIVIPSPPVILSRLNEMFAASRFGITSRFASPFSVESG